MLLGRADVCPIEGLFDDAYLSETARQVPGQSASSSGGRWAHRHAAQPQSLWSNHHDLGHTSGQTLRRGGSFRFRAVAWGLVVMVGYRSAIRLGVCCGSGPPIPPEFGQLELL